MVTSSPSHAPHIDDTGELRDRVTTVLPPDAIVQSGWQWDTWNVPERIAAALKRGGARVLYVPNPVSVLRQHPARQRQPAPVYQLEPRILGHRLNRVPWTAALQARLAANQIASRARQLGLRNPIFVYAHGSFSASVAREMKRRGFFLVHICMDYPEPGQETHIALSDITLVIPETVYHQLHARFGDKVKLIPQIAGHLNSVSSESVANVPDDLDRIPRPRLVYLGPESGRLNLPLIRQVLERNPTWHFVTFEPAPCLALPNVHALPRRTSKDLFTLLSRVDVGFMPYSCADEKNFHCVPLKIFDYFVRGLPVVSTPIPNLSKYKDEVYFGDNSDELTRAVLDALHEAPSCPKRESRIRIAGEHTIDNFALTFSEILSAARPTPATPNESRP